MQKGPHFTTGKKALHKKPPYGPPSTALLLLLWETSEPFLTDAKEERGDHMPGLEPAHAEARTHAYHAQERTVRPISQQGPGPGGR